MSEAISSRACGPIESDVVKVAVCDIDGILRGKYIRADKFLQIQESGFGFCGVIFDWDMQDVCYKVNGIKNASGFPDLLAKVDLSTVRKIPWDENIPFVLADLWKDERDPFKMCPRQVLKSVVGECKQMGFNPIVGCEYEWFNFKENSESLRKKKYQNLDPLTYGMYGYSILKTTDTNSYMGDLRKSCESFDLPLEGLHTETGPGVYEAALSAAPALVAADRAVLFKTATKEIANKHGVTATFMSRWCDTLPGSSGHVHISLTDNNNNNIFYDSKSVRKMSKLFEYFLAGQLSCLPDLLCVFAPTINSYKRLVEGFWAPTHATWGIDDRTCALRVFKGSKYGTRVEVRQSGADTNPYLAIAAAIASGLWGIKNKLELPSNTRSGGGYSNLDSQKLDSNLYDATVRMSRSQKAKDILGEEFVDHFCKTRLWECEQYNRAITDWELRRYLEII